jgi:HD-like signal output (HDOD) protein
MSAAELPPGFKQGLERSLGSLKMLPAVARDALRLAHSPECDFQKLTTILHRDVRLAAFVLKMANSALFSPPSPIASLSRAVSFLGQRRIGDLIVAASLDGLHARVPARQEQPRGLLWVHSFLTAILATQLNQLWGLGLDGEEFAAGLLHDFGRTLILVAEPDRAARIDPLDLSKSHSDVTID